MRPGASLTTALLAGVSTPAMAQAPVDAARVEEIVVTAERRTVNLQDTPIAISAFTERTLDSRGVQNLQNITNFAPNVEIT